MNPFGTFVFCLPLAFAVLGGQQGRPSLPAPIGAILDQRYPGWRVAEVSREVRAAVGQRVGPTPGVIRGDFDGNGRSDYAMLIEYRNTDEPGQAFTHFVEALAFLDNAGSFGLVRLRERQAGPNPDVFLTLQKRGAQGFDFDANKKFTYPHDCIGEWYFGKGGGTYIYRDGRFRYVIEAD
jgi:hypothetical protein